MIALTLCHCRPTKTPTWCCTVVIGVEVDFHFVRFGRYDRRLEEQGRRWISTRVAAAAAHQGRPVPIGDSNKVSRASVDTATNPNSKGSELKPQYFPFFHSHVFGLLKVVRIISRMVWWGDHTYGYNNKSIFSKQSSRFKELQNSPNLFTYHRSHSPLSDIVASTQLIARVRTQWSNQEHKSHHQGTDHSSRWRSTENLRKCLLDHHRSGKPGFQQGARRGFQVMEEERGIGLSL